MTNVLLVYPRFPVTYWGFQDALELVNKSASLPPLGLVTLAACLPERWNLRLVDLNVSELSDDDLRWSDVVFLSGMLVQMESIHDVVRRTRVAKRPLVVGGPSATTAPEMFPDADLIFQGEVEGRSAELVEAVEELLHPGVVPLVERRVLAVGEDKPDLRDVPVPRYNLLELKQYTSMSIQYSRGCPFRCEFCDVIEIFGRVCRVKTSDQILAEFDVLRELGFDGSVFLVDDNFIGNKREVVKLLPRMAHWQDTHGRPYELYTEASINLASDPALMEAMVKAGFSTVFVGIETPSKEALAQAGKGQNLRLDADQAIATMTRAGLEVMGGFIVGFDSDGPEIFDAQRELILSSPVSLAMVGLLIALPGTALWKRLEREGRLRGRPGGDQFERSNVAPTMEEETLLRGYRDLLADLYSADGYYRRCQAYVKQVGPIPVSGWRGFEDIHYLLKAVWGIGIKSPRRLHFWHLLLRGAVAQKHTLKWAVVKALQGEHMIRYTKEHVLPRLERAIEAVVEEKRLAEATRLPEPTLPNPATDDVVPQIA